jgi:hypothetical protein
LSRILREVLIAFLSNFVEITEGMTAVAYDGGGSSDTEKDGTYCTGNYIARINLRSDMPEWIPILGKSWNLKAVLQLFWPASNENMSYGKSSLK